MGTTRDPSPAPPPSERHPGVMLSVQEIEAVQARVRTDPVAEKSFTVLLAAVQAARDIDPETLQFDALNQMAEDAAFVYAVQGEDWPFELSRKLLMAQTMRFSYEVAQHRIPPGPFGHGTWVLSPLIAYDVLASELSITERNIIRERLFLKAADFFSAISYYDNNFQIFLNIGKAAIGLMFEMPDLVETALNAPFGLLDQLGRCILDDGNYAEGTCRYSYAVARSVAMLLRTCLRNGIDLRHAVLPSSSAGGDPPYPGCPGGSVRKTVKLLFDAPIYRMFPGGREASLNDCSYWVSVTQAEIWDLAWRLYEDPQYAAVLNLIARVAPDRLEYRHAFFYRNDDLPNVELDRSTRQFAPRGWCVDGSSVFGEMGYAMLDGEGELDVFFKCGLFGGAHGHADSLNVIMATPDRMLAFDHGTIGGYGAAQRGYAQQTIAHNTITVDQRSQGYWFAEDIKGFSHPVWPYHVDGPGKPMRGELLDFQVRPGLRLVRGKNDNCYPGVCLDRTLMLFDDYVLDVFWAESDDLHTYDWALYVDGDRIEANTKLTELSTPLGFDWGYRSLDELQTCEGLDAQADREEEEVQIALLSEDGTGLCVTTARPLLWPVRTDTGIYQAMGEHTSVTRFVVAKKFPHDQPINPGSADPSALIQRRRARTTCFVNAIEYAHNNMIWIESVKLLPVFVGREPIPLREAEAVVIGGAERRDIVLRTGRDGAKSLPEVGVQTDARVCVFSTDGKGFRRLTLLSGRRVEREDVAVVSSTEALDLCALRRSTDELELNVESRWVATLTVPIGKLRIGQPTGVTRVDPSHATSCALKGGELVCRVSPGRTVVKIGLAADSGRH